MLRRLASSLIQVRGLKQHQQVNITWVKPQRVRAYNPERSGDLEGLPQISKSELGIDYALSDEIINAPESVKKLFTLGQLGRKEYKDMVHKLLVDRVKRHQYDEATAETKIAKITAKIRCLQETMEHFPKNVGAKKTVQELIDRRKKLLKFLRQYDYKKFEWLLEKLNIEYKGNPESFHILTRKQSLKRLTVQHCRDIEEKKLKEYRNLLETQQGPFLKEKLEALKFIRSEQIDLKLPVTVMENDIKEVEEMLGEWNARMEKKLEEKRRKRDVLVDIE